MRLLTLCSVYAGGRIAMVEDGVIVTQAATSEEIGLAAVLPSLVQEVLAAAGACPEAVGVVVGPGSFTGLRAGMSVALGVGLVLGIKVIGVTVAEALAADVPDLAGRSLWTAVLARRGRVFLDQGHGFAGWATDTVPPGRGRIAVCGNAAGLVAATLAARGSDVMLTAANVPQPLAMAGAVARRLAGLLPPLQVEPLYVDAPEARLPAGGLRPAPV